MRSGCVNARPYMRIRLQYVQHTLYFTCTVNIRAILRYSQWLRGARTPKVGVLTYYFAKFLLKTA